MVDDAGTPPPPPPDAPEPVQPNMLPPPPAPYGYAGTPVVRDGMPVEQSALGTRAFMLGLFSLICSGLPGLILGPMAISTAGTALQHPGADHRMAKAGQVLGIIGLTVSAIWLVFIIVALIFTLVRR